jgi:hypothetical protein
LWGGYKLPIIHSAESLEGRSELLRKNGPISAIKFHVVDVLHRSPTMPIGIQDKLTFGTGRDDEVPSHHHDFRASKPVEQSAVRFHGQAPAGSSPLLSKVVYLPRLVVGGLRSSIDEDHGREAKRFVQPTPHFSLADKLGGTGQNGNA